MFDVAVIGGGPAGLMAAGHAAELGAKVILLEKNSSCGKKLLMTGNGRCNVTQDENNIRELVKKYKNGAFLFSAFTKFGPRQMREFLAELGIQTKVEELGRVFPKSDKATDVLKAMLGYLKRGSVEVRYDSRVLGFEKVGDRVRSVKLSDARIEARNFILCTGGMSYVHTGSDGAGYKWAKELGHTIVHPAPALVPLKVKEAWVKELKGLALENVDLRVEAQGKIIAKMQGDLLFTHFGVSGPAVLAISRQAVAALAEHEEVNLCIDLFPDENVQELSAKCEAVLREKARRTAMNAIDGIVPASLAQRLLKIAGIRAEEKAGQVTRQARERLAGCLKNLKIQVVGSMGFETAMVTSGGVDVKEIDPKNMRSKLIENLFFAGEIIDVDGPTGGYNLQLCWSTGWVAGQASTKD